MVRSFGFARGDSRRRSPVLRRQVAVINNSDRYVSRSSERKHSNSIRSDFRRRYNRVPVTDVSDVREEEISPLSLKLRRHQSCDTDMSAYEVPAREVKNFWPFLTARPPVGPVPSPTRREIPFVRLRLSRHVLFLCIRVRFPVLS